MSKGVKGIDYETDAVGIRWDIGTGRVTSKRPSIVPARCGERHTRRYDQPNDCNVTNRICELSLFYAKEAGRELPSVEDTARALKKVLPNRQ